MTKRRRSKVPVAHNSRGSVVLVALVVCGLVGCSAFIGQFETKKMKRVYNFEKPNKKVKLPKALREISGITWWGEHKVAGIQDEDGYVFIIDLKKGEVKEKEKFNKDGDYEDIAKVGKKLYIVRNDGNLYRIKDFDKKDQETSAYPTKLTKKNDVEGLCYDKKNNRLLLLCKEQSGIKKNHAKVKSIYAWDLATKSLTDAPVMTINIQDVRGFCQRKLNVIPDGEFKPSGIAIHPITGQFYVVSSNMKVLVVLTEQGEVDVVHLLPKSIFKQPEGITFDEKASLYISNEGHDGPGNILKFKYRASK
jgi:uncharacterized protein YjiK